METKYTALTADVITFAILFEACSNESAYHFGVEMHEEIKGRRPDIIGDPVVQCNLINLYGKCGMMEHCWSMFEGIEQRPIAVWNAMLHALGRNGDMDGVHRLRERMQSESGLVSDAKTYAVLLNACSHSGDVEEAQRLWAEEIAEEMKSDLYLMTAFVDCLTRKGEVAAAKEMIERYERAENVEGNKVMWMSLLTGCHKHDEVDLAQQVYEEIVHRFRNDTEFVDDAKMVLLHRSVLERERLVRSDLSNVAC